MESLTLLNENVPTLTQLLLVNMPEGTTELQAKRKAMREIMNIEAIFSLKPELAACDPTSILLAVKQCVGDNLTLAPSAGLVYLYPQKVQVGTDPGTNAKIYKQILVYDPTAEGRISIARQSGSILHHKRPECKFDFDGKVESVTFSYLVPTKAGNFWETVTFTGSDFEKWKQKSAAKFGGNANGNYTSWKGGIDPEFAGSKAIRHALKKLGTNKNEERTYQQPHENPHFFAAELKAFEFERQPGVQLESHKAQPALNEAKEIDTTVHNAVLLEEKTPSTQDINPDKL